jgi:hypothetical protein
VALVAASLVLLAFLGGLAAGVLYRAGATAPAELHPERSDGR